MTSQIIIEDPIQNLCDDLESLKEAWSWFTGLGIAIIALGIVSMTLPFVTAITINMFFGTIFFISGLLQLAFSLKARGWRGFLWKFLIGAVYTGAAVLMFFYPKAAVVSLTLVLLGVFLAEGIFKIALSLRIRPMKGWGWLMFSGILALALSFVIFMWLPDSALWVIGLLFGIHLIVWGIWFLVLGLLVKKI